MEKEKFEYIVTQLRMIRNDLQELNNKLDLSNGDAVKCANCGEIVPIDDSITLDSTHETICEQCITDGYGE